MGQAKPTAAEEVASLLGAHPFAPTTTQAGGAHKENSSPSTATPGPAQQIVALIVEMRAAKHPDASRMKFALRLQPEALGQVDVLVTRDANTLYLEIRASNADTKAILDRDKSTIHAILSRESGEMAVAPVTIVQSGSEPQQHYPVEPRSLVAAGNLLQDGLAQERRSKQETPEWERPRDDQVSIPSDHDSDRGGVFL